MRVSHKLSCSSRCGPIRQATHALQQKGQRRRRGAKGQRRRRGAFVTLRDHFSPHVLMALFMPRRTRNTGTLQRRWTARRARPFSGISVAPAKRGKLFRQSQKTVCRAGRFGGSRNRKKRGQGQLFRRPCKKSCRPYKKPCGSTRFDAFSRFSALLPALLYFFNVQFCWHAGVAQGLALPAPGPSPSKRAPTAQRSPPLAS